MRFGLALPHYGFSFHDSDRGGPLSFARAAVVAQTAERLGFDSVWISDHFAYSLERYGGSPDVHGSLEPLVTLAGLASVTERVRLGTLVLAAPFRHPAILAKMTTAIDLLSGGRLDLGIGSGWYRDSFEGFGYRFGTVGERFSVLEETLEVLVRLLDEGPADFDGRLFRLRGAYNHPRPAQSPRPPIWLGAKGGPRSLTLAARLADGWNTVWRWSPSDYAERARAARLACEEVDRDPATLRLSVGLYTLIGEDEADLRARFERMREWQPGIIADQTLESFAADTLTGTPERVRERVSEFEALGVEEIILSPAPVPFALPDPSALDAAAEVLLGAPV